MLKTAFKLSAILIISGISANHTARAEGDRLLTCIKSYTDAGISADLALTECNKKNLATCVQELMSGKYTAKSIRKKAGSNDNLLNQ